MGGNKQSLDAFLLARIDEDEAAVRDGLVGIIALSLATRILADCDAKRQIVAWCSERHRVPRRYLGGGDIARPSDFVPGGLIHAADSVILRMLALPYADHPDYREEWRPE